MIVLVDGYNVINSWPELKKLKEINLEHARDKLIHMMANYRAAIQCEVIIVFDAYQVKDGRERQENIYGVEVMYTGFGQTADSAIERMVSSLDTSSYTVRVVSSDRDEQRIIFGRGATRVSAIEFFSEVTMVNAELRNTAKLGTARTSVKDVINEETKWIMDEWRKL